MLTFLKKTTCHIMRNKVFAILILLSCCNRGYCKRVGSAKHFNPVNLNTYRIRPYDTADLEESNLSPDFTQFIAENGVEVRYRLVERPFHLLKPNASESNDTVSSVCRTNGFFRDIEFVNASDKLFEYFQAQNELVLFFQCRETDECCNKDCCYDATVHQTNHTIEVMATIFVFTVFIPMAIGACILCRDSTEDYEKESTIREVICCGSLAQSSTPAASTYEDN